MTCKGHAMATSDRLAAEGESTVRLVLLVDGERRAAVECVGEVTVTRTGVGEVTIKLIDRDD